MKRRNFVKGAISAIAVTPTGAVRAEELIPPSWTDVTPEEMELYLNEFDLTMSEIANKKAGSSLLRQIMDDDSVTFEYDLFKKGMRSLLHIGNFGDLPLESQAHPEVQKRFQYSLPEIYGSIDEFKIKLQSYTKDEKDQVAKLLKEDPDFGNEILKALDSEAKGASIPAKRRRQLRREVTRVMNRLKQSPDLLIEEYVSKDDKMSRIDEESGRKLMERRLGTKEYERRLKRIEKAVIRWEKKKIKEIPIKYKNLHTDEFQAEKSKRDRANNTLRVGGITFAGGLVFLGIGAIMESSIFLIPGVIAGVTVGPILLLVGLIMLAASGKRENAQEAN